MAKKYPTLKNFAPLFFLLFAVTAFSQTQIFTTSNTFTVPAGVTQLTVEAWGGGGRGGAATIYVGGYAGGGGGGYSRSVLTVTPGNTYTANVGLGSTSAAVGGDSWFNSNTTILAKGGNSVPNDGVIGALGGATSSYGTFQFSGGNGANPTNSPSRGGGGGSSAGISSNGNNGSGAIGGVAPTGGGNGGNGNNNGSGYPGSFPGGGGGGAESNNFVRSGGAGGDGQIIIKWICPTYSLTSTSVLSPICINNGAVVTLNSNSNPTNLPIGTYTVTYNQSAPNPVTGATKTMTVTTAGTGSFTTNALASSGTTTITITNLSSGSCSSAISANVASVIVEALPVVATSFSATATTICSGNNTTLSYSGGSGTTFRWMTGSCVGTTVGTGNNLVVSPTTTTTYFGRWENSCGNSTCLSVTVTVNAAVTSGTIGTAQTICNGATPSALTSTTAGTGSGTITYEWQTNASGSYVTIGSATSATYSPPALTATTSYQRRTVSVSGGTTCYSAYTTAVTITVNNAVTAGAIGTSQTICNGATPSALTSTTAGTGSGTITYEWQTNASGSYVTIGSATSATYSPPALTATTSYQRRTVSVSGGTTCYSAYTTAVTITVNPLPTAPTTTSASICSGSSATLAASGAVAGDLYKWYDAATAGNLLKTSTNNTDNTYITPAIIATTNYWVSIVNSNGCESTRTIVTANIYAINRWTGSTSTNWNTAGNWCIGVPTIGVANTLDVLIPSGLTNYPIIYAGDAPGYVKTIVLENNTTLNVRENSLRVVNNLTLNGLIDLEGESQLLQDTGSTFDAASTGSIEIDQQGTGNSFRYNYWSSPVNSRGTKFTIDEVLRDGNGGTLINKNIDFKAPYTHADGAASVLPAFIKLSTYWMYVLRNSGLGYAAWFRVGNTGEILVGEGYTMKGSNTSAALQNYTFVGKPNNGNISLTLNAGFDYLVGNPYPSAINAAQFLLDNTSTTGEIYFWEHYGGDTHNLAGYQAGYATRNLLDGVPATSAVGVSNLVPPGLIKKIPGPYIAVGQAFFVVGGAVNSQIQFNNGQRDFMKESSGNAVFMKSSNSKAKTENTQAADLRPKFRIGFDAPKISHRQILLGIDERATQAVDWGFDAEIYEIFADDMYWILNNKKYVIQGTNAVSLNSEVPLGIQLSKTGMVTVKIDALENVDDDTAIYLKDKVTGESFNMREKPVQLNLTAGKYADRFVIIFKTQKLVAEDVKAEILIPAIAQPIIEGIHVFMNNALGELQIKNNSTEEILSVALINTLGQTVKTWNSNFNVRTISLPINKPSGVYVVQINAKTGKTVKKISVE